MVAVDIHDRTGQVADSLELDDAIFGAKVNVPAMHQVVVAQLAAARSATSKTKTRAEVAGGGRKPWRQKGTGRARQGSIRAPHWVGGGVAHGPTGEENYTKRVNKKLKRVALRSALSDRASSGNVLVVRGMGFAEPKTKEAVELLGNLELIGRKVLLVLASRDEAVGRSFRNLPDVHVLTVDQLNTYDVLVSDIVLFAEESLAYVGTGTREDLERRDGSAASDPDREVSG